MKIIKRIVPEYKYGIKCPYPMKPTRIVVHNTANDASARSEIAYMTRNNDFTSFHYAVDDKEIVQGIEENRNGFHSGDGGNGKGNREGIAIEICYSKSGGIKYQKAEDNAVMLIVDILKRYGWGIDKVTKHQDYGNHKYCPHRILDSGWDNFINKVKFVLDEANKPLKQDVNVYYRVRTKRHGWLPEVCNLEDYAGWQKSPITDVAIKVDKGTIKYRVHILGGDWLPYVTGYDIKDSNNGFAGIKKPIDAIEIYYNTPDNIRPYKKVYYSVNDYSYQIDNETKNGMDGFGGIIGVSITKLKMYIK